MVLIDLQKAFNTIDHNILINNKLSLHFSEDKAKSFLFSPKHRSKSIGQVDISYKDVRIKEYSKVTYLGSVLDECLDECLDGSVLDE